MIEKIIHKLISLSLFILPLVVLPTGIFPLSYNTPKIFLLYSICAVLLILLLIKYKDLCFDKSDIVLLVFIFLAFISTIFSVNVKTSIFGAFNRHEGLLTFCCYYILYYCAKYYFRPNKITKNIILVVISLICILSILQYYNVPGIEYIFNHSAAGTFGNRNFFGSFISICLPLLICLYLFKGNKIYLIITTLVFYSMLASLTRSAWIAFIIYCIIGFIYIIKIKDKKVLKNFGLLSIAFIIAFLVFFISNPNAILNRGAKTISEISTNTSFGSGRGTIWRAALKIIGDNPIIGCGPDAFLSELARNNNDYLTNEIYPTLKAYPDKAHNEFLQIASTIGIPALLIYLIFLILTIKKLIKNNIYANKIVFVILLSIISYLIQSFFNISTIGVAPIFWIILGYSYQINNYAKLPKKES